MKVNAIIHKVGINNFEFLKDMIAKALRLDSDIIIGPDAALRYDKEEPLTTREEKGKVYKELIELSRGSNKIIAPGTITYPINDEEIVCEAPLFLNGTLFKNFWKERDNGEGNLARENNYIYKKGNNLNNRFNYKDRTIALEICGDHGNQEVRGCDLELILAYDKKAGFWLNTTNNGFSRKAIVCDGYRPKAEAFDYKVDRNPKIKIIKPERFYFDSILGFEI